MLNPVHVKETRSVEGSWMSQDPAWGAWGQVHMHGW